MGSFMNRNCWHVEKVVPLLMMTGFMIHLINIARYVHFGEADISSILLPMVDLPLSLLMLYCSIALLVFNKRFFTIFDMQAKWRKSVYWLIVFYITASIPGHARFLISGDTAYFTFFPWWFSPIIMVVYILFIMFFFSLRRREDINC